VQLSEEYEQRGLGETGQTGAVANIKEVGSQLLPMGMQSEVEICTQLHLVLHSPL
jgi:hypothetical protein